MLASGIFAAHFINTVSPTFLKEVVEGRHPFVPDNIRREMAGKYYSGCASGILNSPDETSTPETDPYIEVKYDAETHVKGKQVNKIAFQTRTGLREDQNAPLFFWPSRLDTMQKGCSLLTDNLYNVVHQILGPGAPDCDRGQRQLSADLPRHRRPGTTSTTACWSAISTRGFRASRSRRAISFSCRRCSNRADCRR